MQQENQYRYKVIPGETVTVNVTPMNGARGGAVSASLNGESLKNNGSEAEPEFEFEAKQEIGWTHNLVMSFGFVDADPVDSYYDMVFSGSEGGQYDPGTIYKEDGYQEPEYVFKVEEKQ